MIRALNPWPLKSPIASTNSLPILPGHTGSQLLQVQYGVKPVPDLANIFQVNCQPPATESDQPEMSLPKDRPRPKGISSAPYEIKRCLETNPSRERSRSGLNWL